MKNENNKFMSSLESINQRLSEIKTLKTITDGLLGVLPLIIVGAVFSLIANFPVSGYQDFLEQVDLKETLTSVSHFTTDIIALLACMSLTHVRIKRDDLDSLVPVFISLVAFLIITPLKTIKDETYLPFKWLGSSGFFMGIIIGIAVGAAYVFMIKHNWIIQLPKSVPPMVAKSLSSVVPTTLIIAVAIFIRYIFELTKFETIHNVIYSLIQQPLTHIGTSIWTMVILTLVAQLFWFIGIHGMLVVMPILLTVFLPLDIQNLAAFNNGQALPYITTIGFWIICTSIGGGGATLGLNLMMAFRAKSDQFKVLGKLALPAGFFGINEPLVYGVPLVYNAIFFIPYVFLPVINLLLGYLLIKVGILPSASGATILGMPIPIFFTGLMEGSWKLGLFQVGLLLFDSLVYYPFFKTADNAALKEQKEEAK
ncbi:cellobiose-specific PTS system IIC component [Ligilactobacillus salitolerans]|uniref:Permease IIC component n=1 Tax=Ligilactobacillus salitolerans TaxID=1808352 RepID=A0A401IQD0_9LACO|nr:PTS transporter subunit EIIC [Ligilactobacillus salitolerans]GBG93723.1 cellobiose-specific PTS system IIC component [Ligilactobacillus salitolerans]